MRVQVRERARSLGLVVEVLSLSALGSHMGTASNPGSSASYPALCLWPGKAGGWVGIEPVQGCGRRKVLAYVAGPAPAAG